MKLLKIHTEEGMVTMVALSLIVIFSMMASSLGFRGGLEVKLVKRQLDLFRERYLTQAAVTGVEYLIEKDEKPEEDGPFDAWHNEPEWPENIQFEEGVTVFVKVTDEESKVNINYASEALLKGLFELIDEEKDLKTEIDELVAAIMNWRGDSAAGGGAKLGEKHKGSPFESLDELYLIKKIEPEDIPKVLPYLTVHGIGVKNQAIVNPNTASPIVLAALVQSLAGDVGAKEDVSEALTHYRELLDSEEQLPEEEKERSVISYFSNEDIRSPENFHVKLEISNIDPLMQAIVIQLLTYFTVDSKFFNIYVDIKENESSLGTKSEIIVGYPMERRALAQTGSRARPRRPAAGLAAQGSELSVLSWRDA